MKMCGVPYLPQEFDIRLAYQITEGLKSLRHLVASRGDASEIIDTVFSHAMRNFQPSKGELIPYLAKLLTETRVTNKSEVHFDALDKVISDQVLRTGSKKDSALGKTVVVNTDAGISPRVDTYDKTVEKIVDFALDNLPSFVTLCEALVLRNSQNQHFAPIFKKSAKSLYSEYPERFIPICMELYNKYGSQMREFVQEDPKGQSDWVEADYVQQRVVSKRIKFLHPDGTMCVDPDKEPYAIKGTLGDRHLYKVRYRDLYDLLSEYIDSLEINPIKFCIGESYVFRTLGGSYSLINSSLFSQYDAALMEIISNLVRDLSARYITHGSEFMYFLVPPPRKPEDGFPVPKKRVVRGVSIQFMFEDITDKVQVIK